MKGFNPSLSLNDQLTNISEQWVSWWRTTRVMPLLSIKRCLSVRTLRAISRDFVFNAMSLIREMQAKIAVRHALILKVYR